MEPRRFDRREALKLAGVGLGTLVIPAMSASDDSQKARPPALAAETVREFVGAAHGDLEKTKQMLAKEPGLLNAVWDWGGGDFESAIGGAGHMGRADIAEFLISNGARTDVFVAAMLGQLEVVKSILTANPSLRQSAGPHGIPLLTHAKNGGERAKAVVEYLNSLGLDG